MLPDTDLKGVDKVGLAILKSIRSLAIPHEKSELTRIVTLSVGGTSIIPCRNSSPNTLIQKADGLLYESKAQGRDRMTVRAINPE